MANYKGYIITQDQDTKVYLIFREMSTVGKQVVEIAEDYPTAMKKVDQLESGEIIPIFYQA